MSETAAEVTFATALFLLHRAGLDVEDTALGNLAQAIGGSKSSCDAAEAAEKLAAVLLKDGGFHAGLGRAFSGMKIQVVCGDHHAHVAALRRARFGNQLPMLAGIADRHNGGVAIRWAIVLDVGDVVEILDPNPWDDIAEDHKLPMSDFVVRWELAGSVLVTFRSAERP